MSDQLTCFRCNDGHTPLYCLNCAGDVLGTRALLTELRSYVAGVNSDCPADEERDALLARIDRLLDETVVIGPVIVCIPNAEVSQRPGARGGWE